MAFNKDRLKQAYMIAEDGYIEATKKSALYLKDKEGRTIRIGKNYGIQALDSEGTVIHDTPDCLIASNMTYGGHVIWKDTPPYIGSILAEFSDTETSRTYTSSVNNIDLSSHLPTGLTNIKGILIFLNITVTINKTKTQDSTWLSFIARYSKTFNVISSTSNYLATDQKYCVTTDAENKEFMFHKSIQSLIPITWNSETPYMTWQVVTSFVNMTAENDMYSNSIYIYLQGFLV